MKFEEAFDDVNGSPLDPVEVRKARQEELKYYREMEAFEIVPTSLAWERSGKAPVDVRWIDHKKGDIARPQVRCRLVAKDFKTGPDADLYAGTPPLEALKLILSHATTGSTTRRIMTNDVSRAYLHSPCRSEVFVRRVEEDIEFKYGDNNIDNKPKGSTCWRLKKSMYGTRPAAQDWQRTVAETLGAMGFVVGRSCPNTYWNKDRGLLTFVHGDDFCSAGEVPDLLWMKSHLEKSLLIKTQVLGPDRGQQSQVRMLNRLLTWEKGVGIYLEADTRHVDKVVEELNVGHLKPLKVLGTRVYGKHPADDDDNDDDSDTMESDDQKTQDIAKKKSVGMLGKQKMIADKPLAPAMVKKYRSVVARLNYLIQERPDIAYSTKELARRMSDPGEDDYAMLKRLARYLVGKPRLRILFSHQPDPGSLLCYTDSDWAGCLLTRRSTSGGILLRGSHLIKCWSKTQQTVALSSAEAELYASVKGAAELMGARSILRDFGIDCAGHVLGDASAALGVIRRHGLGRLRHIDCSYLWIQERAASKTVRFDKVKGSEHPADSQTKYLGAEILNQHVKAMGCDYPKGKNDFGLKLNMLEGRDGGMMVDCDDGNREGAVDLGLAHSGFGSAKETLRKLIASTGRLDSRIWTRHDLASSCYRSSSKTCPEWRQVVARMTIEAGTGKVIEARRVEEIPRDQHHGRLPGGKSNIVTYLAYVEDRWDSRS